MGAAQASLELALQHLAVREQFGKQLLNFQWSQFKLAEMATKVGFDVIDLVDFMI